MTGGGRVTERRSAGTPDALPTPAPAPAPGAWSRWAGIDPGADVGLVSLHVPPDFDITRARLVGYGCVAESSSTKLARATRKALLLHRVRDRLVEWQADHIVMEQNYDVLVGGFRGKGQERRGQSGETAYWQGVHGGLVMGAAVTLPWTARLWGYPATSRIDKKDADGEPILGWMQHRAPRPTPRDVTLQAMRALFRTLQRRPADGRLPTGDELAQVQPEHVYMALGVLAYHLERERGRVLDMVRATRARTLTAPRLSR